MSSVHGLRHTSVVITWALNRITDRFGNHIDFVYTNDATDQVLRPATITYTTPPSGVSGVQTTANYQVQFAYVSRTSTVPGGFVTGAQFMEPYLAQTITVAAWNGSAYAAVRTYNLTYTTGTTTGRSQLTSIQECSPTQCFPATTVGYQNGTPGWSSAVSTSAKSTTLDNAYVVDLNGDGVDDIVYQDSSHGNAWYYMLGTTSGSFEGPYALGFTPVAPIDYNSDGKMDLLAVSSGNLHVMSFSSPGGAFTDTNTGVPAPANAGPGYLIVGDVDGDGRDDIIYAVSSGSSWTTPDHIYYRLNTGSGFGSQQTLATIQGGAGCKAGGTGTCKKLTLVPLGQVTPYYSRVRRPDVNGDGRIDFFVDIESCTWVDTKCSGSTTLSWNLYVSDASVVGYDQLDALADGAGVLPPIFGDFNGDGCTDVATIGSNGHWFIQYGTCLRSGAQFALSAAVDTGVAALPGYPLVIDWDGDGMDDIVQSSSATGGTLYYAKSTGTSLKAFVSTGLPYNNGDTIEYAAVIADINGDGLYDIVFPTTSANTVSVLTHQGATVTPDLATSFTDGFGFNYSPIYAQLTNSTLYNKGSGAAYPEQNVQPAMTVVSSYAGSDGVGGTYTVSEVYTDARQNLQRRQYEGFEAVRSVDSRDNLNRWVYFGQLFPQTGMLSRQSVYQSDDRTFITDVQRGGSACQYRFLVGISGSAWAVDGDRLFLFALRQSSTVGQSAGADGRSSGF